MNPLSVRARNLRSYPALDFEIPEGVVAVTGPNGAGKSTLLGAIELALFADGTRDLAPALGPFDERMSLELVFEHSGETFRVRRSYSAAGRGKATLDLDCTFSPDGYRHQQPLTAESAAATQERINSLLGLGRATFRASAFMAQGDSAAFPEASPAERKAILGAILDPAGLWPRFAERARGEARAAEAEIAGAQARLADREMLAAEVPALGRAADVAGIAEQQAQATQAEAEQRWEAAQLRVHEQETAQERARGAEQTHSAAILTVGRASQSVKDAETYTDMIPALDAAIAEIVQAAARIPALEARAEEQRTAALRADAARKQKQDAEAAIGRAQDVQARRTVVIDALRREFDQTVERYEHLEISPAEGERCDLCQQQLGAEARTATIAALRAQARAMNDSLIADLNAAARGEAELGRLKADAGAIEIPETPEDVTAALALSEAREQAAKRSGLEERLARAEAARAQLPALRQALETARADEAAQAALSAAAQAEVGDAAALQAKANDARAALEAAQGRLSAATAERARAQEAFERAQAAAEEARTLRQALAEQHAALDLLRLAERAFGRDGIPAWIAENSCGQIEAEANRVLERLPCASGAVLRCELRTQRALKGDASAVRETLDIMVADSQGAREFLTYSGGERWRVAFALRWALARLLAGRRGAESRLLVIDEPDGLDAGGMDALAALLAEERAFSKVLLVSHQPLLASAFEQVVEVASDGEISRLVGAAEMEA